MYSRFRKILNKMVSYERSNANYFELGEFLDMGVNQVPYIRMKNLADGIRQWELNSLKIADAVTTGEILEMRYNKQADVLTDEHMERTYLFPVNIICQLIQFLHLYQNRKKYCRKKLKVSLENSERNAVCKIYTDINSSDHWFTKDDEKIWNMVRQYTSAINLHSSYVEVERLSSEDKCLILIRFDMHEYCKEENIMLDMIKKRIGVEHVREFRKNDNHVLYGSSEEDFIKLVDSRIIVNKKNSLYWEYKFMERLQDFRGFPNAKQYMKIGQYEIYIADNVQGQNLGEYLTQNSNDMDVSLLFKLFDQTQKLRQNFIRHRDLKSSNVIITPAKDVYIIDFDQAMFSVDFSDKSDLRMSRYSRSTPLYSLNITLKDTPKVKEKISSMQKELRELWAEAATSDSNSPGRNIAYYSYSFGDADYVGERDFFERWILLEKNNISFKDKTVVELGCNIGLFGAYSALYGARDVRSFDIDSKIVQCAKKLASIMELNNIKHEVRDLNIKDNFSDINKVDFMFALSVFYWLKDTGEFDRLMKLAEEVLYEGHEQYNCEYKRLKEWGFTEIKAVGITDRLRTIFYARK